MHIRKLLDKGRKRVNQLIKLLVIGILIRWSQADPWVFS